MIHSKKVISVAVLLFCALCVFAQAFRIDLNNVTVRRAMTELRQKSGYSFVFETSDLNTNQRVSVNADNLQDAIRQILNGQDVSYEIQGKSIVLSKGRKAPASDRQDGGRKQTVRGRILDAQGAPLVGVTIREAGTSNGVISDLDGNFSISVPEGATLEASCLGFKTLFLKAEGTTPLSIRMQEDLNALEEAVVIGYGSSRRKDITGSVASVKAETLNTVSSANVSQMLQGKVAGMSSVQSSAQPGAGMSVTIRGAASPNGSNAPLYVVDGVPLQTFSTADPGLSTTGYELMSGVDRDPLNTINPNDIESIEVLKDASAAIYGASAANGVILITTKSGRSGKPKVEWRSVLTAQLPKPYPHVLNAHDFREQANLWTKEYYLYNNKMGVYGPNAVDLSGYVPVFADVNNYKAETDWMKEVSQTGYVIDQNLTVNGGNDYTKYFFSYNFYDNQGLLKQSGLHRHSVRLNLDQKFSERIDAGIKFTYSNVNALSTSVGDRGNGDNMIMRALDFAPDVPVYDENGNFSKSYTPLHNNPVSYTIMEDKAVTERIFIAPSLDIKLLDGLVFKAVGGYDGQTTTRNFYLPVAAMNSTVPEGMASSSLGKVFNMSAEGYFNYDKEFGGIHHISAVLGAGYYKTATEGFGLTAADFFTDAFGYNNVGIASDKEKEAVRSWKTERTKLSQFARVNYSLMDRYIITATLRRDGSSYFAENNKWGLFPSISVAWRMTEEDFMKNLPAVSDFKLRASYGATGNENVLGTNSLSFYSSGYNFLIGSTMHTGLMLTQIENPNLKWETDYTLNLGLDFGFLNQRISGSIDVYRRGVKDLLDYQVLPSNNVVGRVAANIGETKSEGFEFSLKSDNIRNYKFRWETLLNITYTRASWVKRNPEVALAEYIGETDDLDTIYGWQTAGIIKSPSDIPSYMPNAYVGNIIYVDQNKDNVLDSKDVVKLGHRTPRWMIGLGNTFNFHNFDLNFYFYAVAGYRKSMGQVPDAGHVGNRGAAPINTYATVITDVWNSQTGSGWIPGIASNPYNGSNPSGTNDFFLMSGSYIKLKNITLGYSLPDHLFNNSRFVQGARFFFDAQNVWTITKYKGFDPELATGNPYPQALSLSFGFNLNF
ncbi:MAG: TonB-dependent receptor [Bacteroidales bacterium]|nr:TonB-dependent receptor [Bacteroidales bacterium]